MFSSEKQVRRMRPRRLTLSVRRPSPLADSMSLSPRLRHSLGSARRLFRRSRRTWLDERLDALLEKLDPVLAWAERQPERVQRALWGLRWGFILAIGFTLLSSLVLIPGAILLVLALLSGDLQVGEPWDPRIKAILWAVPIYFTAGPAGGLVVGLLHGFTRWWIGRRIVAMLATLPGAFLTGYLVLGFREWSAREVAVCTLFAVIWGGMMSFIPERDARAYWQERRRRT